MLSNYRQLEQRILECQQTYRERAGEEKHHRFFRHIRRRSLANDRFTRYLYALGEMVLVVIGILTALNVNNWNEQRKMRIDRTGSIWQKMVTEMDEKSPAWNLTRTEKGRWPMRASSAGRSHPQLRFAASAQL